MGIAGCVLASRDEELRRVPDESRGIACLGIANHRPEIGISVERHPETVFGEIVCEIPGTAPDSNRFEFRKEGRDVPIGIKKEMGCYKVDEARIQLIEILTRMHRERAKVRAGPLPLEYVSLNKDMNRLIAAASSSQIGVEVAR